MEAHVNLHLWRERDSGGVATVLFPGRDCQILRQITRRPLRAGDSGQIVGQ